MIRAVPRAHFSRRLSPTLPSTASMLQRRMAVGRRQPIIGIVGLSFALLGNLLNSFDLVGTTGHAELTSALMTATGGGDFGMLTNNPSFNLTSIYHIYATGMTSLFNYGDHGPNKFSTTANSLLFYGNVYKAPTYTLFQRDRFDAAEPWSMFWYDPT